MILQSLQDIAAKTGWLAVAWHIAVAIAATGLAAGFRPRRDVAAALLSAPLASVSAVAFVFENPFNGAVFALLALGLAGLAHGSPRESTAQGDRWALALGACLVTFAWAYPHFLGDSPWFVYLSRAPLGTIPCPTLSLVVGAALMGGGVGRRAWRFALALAGLLYSLLGALWLGVWLDLPLLVGSLGLMALSLSERGHCADLSQTALQRH